MQQLVSIAAALADPGRVRVLSCLRRGELCACHLIELLALAPSTVSKHMSILRNAGLVLARRDGRWMHYRLPEPDAPAPALQALAWVWRALDGDPQAAADAARLKAILKLCPEELCKQQRKAGPGTAVGRAKGAGACGPGCCSCAPATPAAARSPRRGRARSGGE